MKTVLVCIIRGIVRCMRWIRRAYRRMSPTQKCIMYVAIFAVMIGGILGGLIGKAVEKKKAEANLLEVSKQIREEEMAKQDILEKEIYDLKAELNPVEEELPWNLTFPNSWKLRMESVWTSVLQMQ